MGGLRNIRTLVVGGRDPSGSHTLFAINIGPYLSYGPYEILFKNLNQPKILNIFGK